MSAAPRYAMRASGPVLDRVVAHLRMDGGPDGAGARLVLIGAETPPSMAPSVLWFVFQNDRGEEAVIGMAPAGGDAWAFNGRTLKFCFSGPGTGLTGLHQLALKRLAARLDGAPFERFTRLVDERTGPPPPEPLVVVEKAEKPAERQRSEDWAHLDQWREFCFYSVIDSCPAETFLGHYAIVGTSRAVRYGDLECQISHGSVCGVVQTPWAFTPDPYRKDTPGGGQEYLAMIDDSDVIHGTGVRKVERILDCLAEDPTCHSLEFFNGCIPMMTGDDVQGALARFRERTGRKVVFSDMSAENCHHESLARLIADNLSAPRGARAGAAGGRYDLVGFRSTRGRDELVEILAAAGAELNLAVIPEFQLESLAKYRDASVQALMPNRYYQDVYDVLGGSGLATLEGCAPYGRAASAQWLRRVAALLGGGAGERLEAVLAERDGASGPEWRSLTARAGAHRAGFVLGPGDAAKLADPARSGGVLVPALLAEMGFALDFLEFSPGGEPASAEAAALRDSLPDPSRHAVAQFSDEAGLLDLFRSGRLSLVYSNARGDRRLTRNGLTGFSLKDIEMGPPGALRTLRRLVERCEVPFFRENAARLRAAA